MLFRRTTVALSVLCVLLLSGCGGGGGRTDRDLIIDNYRMLADAIEQKNIRALMALVSLDYLHDGVDREGFKAVFEAYFDQHINIEARFSISSIEFESVDHQRLAYVTFDSVISGDLLDASGLIVRRESEVNEDSVMVWTLEDGYWRMLGNQEEARALSIEPGKRSIGSLLGSKAKGTGIRKRAMSK
ncbi:MAG: hypothetical protein ACUVRO_06620 [Armatimonadota bacterium]